MSFYDLQISFYRGALIIIKKTKKIKKTKNNERFNAKNLE
jgi:hypothetical protein